MTFPQTPLNTLVEINIDGVWTNITSYVMRDPIQITRGRADEGSLVEASVCSMTLNNRDGRFSPRNPTSPYYGILGRNTPIRVSLPDITGTADDKRFTGEVASWPQKWDKTGTDVYVTIECAGILRRLGQHRPIFIPAYKEYLVSTNPRAYWPLDEGTNATFGKSATPFNTSRFVRLGGSVNFGAGDLGETMPAGVSLNGPAVMSGDVGSLNTITASTVDFVALSENLEFDWGILEINGSFYEIDTRFDGTNDDLRVRYWDDTAFTMTTLGSTPALTIFTDGLLHHFRFQIVENGANVDWELFVDGVSQASGSNTSQSVRGCSKLNYTGLNTVAEPDVSLGHVAVWHVNGSGDDPPALANVIEALEAHEGETAAARMSRLCTDAGVAFTLVGTAADTMPMGRQQSEKTLLEHLRECEAADRGILYEPRDSLGLTYRTRTNLYSQTAAVELDYSDAVFGEVPEPVDDDQETKNDVTITLAEDEEASARAVLESGPLSILDPPDGVGLYQYSESVNIETSDRLSGLAYWILNLGTIDKARYPVIALNLARSVFTSNATLTGQVAGLDVGDYLTITNLPAWLPPDQVDLLAQGFIETLHNFSWDIAVNCVPGDLYLIPKFEAATPPDAGNERARFDAEGSTLSTGINTSATSLSVAGTATLWVPDDAEDGFDIIIGGERMTVTDISGTTSPQTFTVTRSVNGIVKSHSSGAEVRLFLTPTFGL